jgi:hypothetical protein
MARLSVCVLHTVVSLLVCGCIGMRVAELPPDEQYAHRYDQRNAMGRTTIDIREPDSTRAYFVYPVVIDSLHVRPAPFLEGVPVEQQSVKVEVLLKGSFPDVCSELHAVRQERFGHLLNVWVEMRRPRGVSCPAIIQPFRFYFDLEGLYTVGSYTLKINGTVYPFTIRPPAE